jgi:hypothetical protein
VTLAVQLLTLGVNVATLTIMVHVVRRMDR